MELVFDIEGNGLLVDVPNNDNVKEATEIFCIVAIDENNQVYKFYGDTLSEGMTLLQKADTLIGHNIIGYDIPLAKKILGIDLSDKNLIDTLVLSRLFKPTREGGHSLEKWAYRLGGTPIIRVYWKIAKMNSIIQKYMKMLRATSYFCNPFKVMDLA